MRSGLFSSFAVFGAVLIVASCSKSTEPQQPTTLVVTPSGSITFASLNQTAQLSVKVLDQHGDTVPGVTPTYSTNSAATATVSTSGLVTAKANGSATITVTAAGLTKGVPVIVAQVPSFLVPVAGDGQLGTAGGALSTPLAARVLDAKSYPIAGVSVAFAVTSGGGSVSPLTGTTNAAGDATTSWTLGPSVGAQQVRATAGALSTTFDATASSAPPAQIAPNGGNNQTWVVNAPVPVAPSVKVTDTFGNPSQGASVTFTVTGGGGSVTGATKATDAGGIATVGSWTLGSSAGTNTLQASVSGVASTATFTATAAVAGAPASVTVLSAGNGQTGLVSYALNVRPAVLVTDVNNRPVANVSVTFAVASGGGSLTNATVNTNASGIAQVGSWLMGSSAGSASLTATVAAGGVTGNPATINATAVTGSFQITLQNFGPALSPAVQTAFDSAVAKWQRIIYQDVPDIANFSAQAGQCGTGSPAIGPVSVDDILILVKFDSIDGVGKILGQAGPCFIRNGPADFRTVMGVMRFDTADVANLIAQGRINDVILHEMGHVLGYGTLWISAYYNCLQNPSSTGSLVDTYYNCPKALAEFDSIGGTTYTGGSKVPVENCVGLSNCGAGTYNSHWRESTFFNELMTGFLNSGTVNPMSVLSIASMEDLGYTVNYAAADPYTRVFTSPPALRAAGEPVGIHLQDDVYYGPIYVLDRAGRVIRVIQR